jgi:hypothetical protein
MFQDLLSWRSNLDSQVTKYKVVSFFVLHVHVNILTCTFFLDIISYLLTIIVRSYLLI